MSGTHTRHHVTDVRGVVANHQLAVLAGHPARDDLTRPRVEAMQSLNRDEEPSVDARDRLEVRREALGLLRITMEADEEARRCTERGPNAITTVHGSLHGVDSRVRHRSPH